MCVCVLHDTLVFFFFFTELERKSERLNVGQAETGRGSSQAVSNVLLGNDGLLLICCRAHLILIDMYGMFMLLLGRNKSI